MDKEIIASRIANPLLREAFMKVDRRDYLPEKYKNAAYDLEFADEPLWISESVTTTALNLGLFMLDSLELSPGLKVLEVGTGNGYYTSLMAEVAEIVVTVEIDREVLEFARKNLSKYRNVIIIEGDGSVGYEPLSPYDRAVIWAASPTLPCKIFDQLKEGGVMVVPIGSERRQTLYKVRKKDGRPEITRLGDVIFMKMRGVCGFYD
ncbi:MAG: protein-L-isoaspartate O-methyltransferase family protein [Thermoprotei archaeon]